MARLPLHTLPTFQAVARLQNLRAAADQLHITHSAVSQQIRVLEEQIGFSLFDRRGRRVVLNPAGQALLRSVEPALAQLDDGLQAAAAAASGAAQRLRLTMLPSFANRWLLPRMSRWRERHPELAIEIDATPKIVDLQREGFHAAIRQGTGPWPGLVSERLFDKPMPFVLVGSPAAAKRLLGAEPAAFAREPLLGDVEVWDAWFAAAGVRTRVVPVAEFNDAGLMLQATEHNLGLSVVRELLAADALVAGRLVQLSPLTVPFEEAYIYHLAYPQSLQGWEPLEALRAWLREELEASMLALHPKPAPRARRSRARG